MLLFVGSVVFLWLKCAITVGAAESRPVTLTAGMRAPGCVLALESLGGYPGSDLLLAVVFWSKAVVDYYINAAWTRTNCGRSIIESLFFCTRGADEPIKQLLPECLRRSWSVTADKERMESNVQTFGKIYKFVF